MTVTFAITVCDEAVEIERLVTFLLKHKRIEDNIVVLYDDSKKSVGVEEFLRSHSVNGEFNWHRGTFQGDFADWKNKLNRLCTGDYIFQLDADETIPLPFLEYLPELLETFKHVDVFRVPRVNIVYGITPDHVDRWNWNQNHLGHINWPDYQSRLYRNAEGIRWEGYVHEQIVGYTSYANIPAHKDYALHHYKTIERQERQNEYYANLR